MNRKITIAAIIAMVATLPGCNQVEAPQSPSETLTEQSSPVPPPPPAPAAKAVLEDSKGHSSDLNKEPLVIKTNGKILDAKVIGKTVSEPKIIKISDKQWEMKGLLKIDSKYAVNVTVENNEGLKTTNNLNFTTVDPKNMFSPAIYPVDDQKVGVGMPVTIYFKKPVKDKEKIEKLLKIKTTPTTKGSWGWIENDTTIVWKPNKLWKPGTKISVEAPVEGIDFGNGFGKRKVTTKFEVGRELKIKISNDSKEAVVIENGKTLRTIPVSLGKPGKRTSSGTNIIYEKANPTRMRGEGYDQIVNYAQRYNTTGEYIHSAPWSVGSQGYTNVSHGCVNINPTDAKWLYNKTFMGDIVEITGTGRKADEWDGMGAIWNYSDTEWKKLSALK